jgi:hypothetical protein
MTKMRKTDFSDIDIHELLTQRRQVAVIWSIEDVQAVRPDLTDDQAWEVLKRCEKRHDAEIGFTWQFIELIAEEIFSPPQDLETNEEGA